MPKGVVRCASLRRRDNEPQEGPARDRPFLRELLLHHDVRNDAGGDRNQQEFAIVGAHPVVTAWRFAQPVIVITLDHDHASVIAMTSLPACVRRGPAVRTTVVVPVAIMIAVAVVVAVVMTIVATVMTGRATGRWIERKSGYGDRASGQTEDEFSE